MEKMKFPEKMIQGYLYGYNDIRLVTSEDVLNTLQKDLLRNGHRLPESPPLSPRKIRTPDEVSLCTSSLPGNLFGSCAIKRIQHGTWFGPFEGKLVRTTEVTEGVNNEYMWEIFHDGEVSHYLDGFNENNWMSFVRCARHKKEQNLVVFQYHGCIYYRTIKDVQPGTELLVWYDSKYTQLLGIPLAWNDNRSSSNKRKSTNCVDSDVSKKRKAEQQQQQQQIPLLQKLENKQPLRRPQGDIATLLEVTKKLNERNSSLSPTYAPPAASLRCKKCLFNFRSKDQLSNHKCLATSWTPMLRLPSMDRSTLRMPSMHSPRLQQSVSDKSREPALRLPSIDKLRENPFSRPMHINMPYTDPVSYYQNYYQHHFPNYHYPSPPMDTFKHLPPASHKGVPIPIKNY